MFYEDIPACARAGLWFLEYYGASERKDARRRFSSLESGWCAGYVGCNAAQNCAVSRSRNAETCWRPPMTFFARSVRSRSPSSTRAAKANICGTHVRAARGGAIPGAIHIEWTDNLARTANSNRTTNFKRCIGKAGITPDKEVVSYCQGGYRAAHSYVALRLLGFPKVRNYIGSWKEWGDRADLPIEIPKPSK